MNKNKIFLNLIIFILGFFVFAFPSLAQELPQVFQNLPKATAVQWPNDIPLFPGAISVQDSVDPETYPNPSMLADLEIGSLKAFWLINQGSPGTAVSWYQENLPQNGWTVFSKDEFTQIYNSFEIKEFEGISNLFSSLPGGQKIDIEYIYGKQYLSSWKPEIHTKTRTNVCRFFSVQSFDIDMAEDNFRPLMLMEITTKTSCPNVCEIPPEIEQERQELINKIGKTYGFRIGDSNLCGREDICGTHPPWSMDELMEMENTLNKLPACFTNNLKLQHISGLIEVLPDSFGEWTRVFNLYKETCCNIEDGKPLEKKNTAFYFPLTSSIIVCDKNHYYLKYDIEYSLEYVLVHEITHSFQWHGAIIPSFCDYLPCPGGPYTNPIMVSWLKKTGWSLDGICIPFLGCPGATFETPEDLPTQYAKDTNDPTEDMAESVALYVTNPEQLLEISPRRYNFVRDKIMCGKEYL